MASNMGSSRIELYLDITSLYSYVAFIQLLETKDLLKQHWVKIEIHPVLLGAVNAGSGNKPPWTLPAKATYGRYEAARALKAVGLGDVSPPGDLFEAGKTQLPLRALHYIKTHYPEPVFYTTFHFLFHCFWTLHRLPNSVSALEEILSEISSDFTFSSSSSSPPGGKKLFTPSDAKEVVAAASSQALKDTLRTTVTDALKRGAFGAPWLWVTREGTGKDGAEGKIESEPFFGSDRWYAVYEFLGLPYQNVKLLAPGGREGETTRVGSKL